MQDYVIKFVSNLPQVGGFLRVFRFQPPITDDHDIAEILLKVALNTINPNINPSYVCEEMSYKWNKWILDFFLERSIRVSSQIIMLNNAPFPSISFIPLQNYTSTQRLNNILPEEENKARPSPYR